MSINTLLPLDNVQSQSMIIRELFRAGSDIAAPVGLGSMSQEDRDIIQDAITEFLRPEGFSWKITPVPLLPNQLLTIYFPNEVII